MLTKYIVVSFNPNLVTRKTFLFLSLPQQTIRASSNFGALYLHSTVPRRTRITDAALVNGDRHVRASSPMDDVIRVGRRRWRRSLTISPTSPFSPGIPGLPPSPCREAIKKRCRQCQQCRKWRILPILGFSGNRTLEPKSPSGPWGPPTACKYNKQLDHFLKTQKRPRIK